MRILHDLECSPYLRIEQCKTQAEGGTQPTRFLQSVNKRSAGGLPRVNKSDKSAFKRHRDGVADASQVNSSYQQRRWPEFGPERQVSGELIAPQAQQRDTAPTSATTALSALTSRRKACCRLCCWTQRDSVGASTAFHGPVITWWLLCLFRVCRYKRLKDIPDFWNVRPKVEHFSLHHKKKRKIELFTITAVSYAHSTN